MQLWALLLAAYRYEIEFRLTLQHANADCLSRLPLSIVSEPRQHDHEMHMLNMLQIQILPVNAEQIVNPTRRDPILSRVTEFTHTQWPTQVSDELKPYFVRHNELMVEEDCLLWGIHFIVPLKLRHHVLDELHMSHLGIVCIKSLTLFMFGGLTLTKTLRRLFKPATHVSWYMQSLHKHQHSHEFGLLHLGNAFMWILLVHFLATCS